MQKTTALRTIFFVKLSENVIKFNRLFVNFFQNLISEQPSPTITCRIFFFIFFLSLLSEWVKRMHITHKRNKLQKQNEKKETKTKLELHVHRKNQNIICAVSQRKKKIPRIHAYTHTHFNVRNLIRIENNINLNHRVHIIAYKAMISLYIACTLKMLQA